MSQVYRVAVLVTILLLLLAGCAAPEVRTVVKEVKVPVPQPCAAKVPEEPMWSRGLVDLETATGDQKVAALEAELIQREAYEDLLKSAIKNC